MNLAVGLVLALLSTAAISGGVYLQHSASSALPALDLRHPVRSLCYLFTSRRWLAGLISGVTGLALYIAALRFAPLSLVQATLAGGVGLLALLVRRGGGSLSRLERVAVTASVGGLLLLGLSLSAGAARAATPGWAGPLLWALASMLIAALAAGPAAAGLPPVAAPAAPAWRRARGRGRPALFSGQRRNQGSGRWRRFRVLVLGAGRALSRPCVCVLAALLPAGDRSGHGGRIDLAG